MTRKKAPSKRRKRKSSSRKKASHYVFRIFRNICFLTLLIFVGWVFYLDHQVQSRFEGEKWSIPARVYAQPLEIYEGKAITRTAFEQTLKDLGYRFVAQVRGAGQVSKKGKRYFLQTKGFTFHDGVQDSLAYQVIIDNGLVTLLTGDNDWLRLEPMEIGSIYPAHGEDRVLVSLSEIPPLLGETLIAVEDKAFAHHHGFSLKGIARAMIANLKAGNVVQGGSTLTQQLVKNFYLTHERSLWRKFKEAIMAVLLEIHFSKADILEAYLNEVYLGQSGPRSIHGFGLASTHYFNRPLSSLSTDQLALLVGLVKGASYYQPWRHPQRALERRNLVLSMMHNEQLISDDQLKKYQAKPLGVVAGNDRRLGDYPAFLDLVKRQLLQQYNIEDLQSEGLRIFTTLSPEVQKATENSIQTQMARLQGRSKAELQAAAIVTAVGTGEVLAVVGDKNPRFSGFNRALDAERQIGSLVKPFVFQTALMQPDKYHLFSQVADTPFRVEMDNGVVWEPRNFDLNSRDEVFLLEALVLSYNQATARLGMALGIDNVMDTLQKAGLNRELEPLPSMLLGALSLSPFEVSHLYQTLASDGTYIPLRAIRSVLDSNNQPLNRYPLKSTLRFDASTSHMMHYALQAVMRSGTGRKAYEILPPTLAIAGKTGTTNNYRDSWFAGYSGDHLGVVWLGNDNNKPTGLTGSAGALTVWRQIFKGFVTTSLSHNAPETIEYYWIDSQNGMRADQRCANAQLVPFVVGHQPSQQSKCQKTSRRWSNWLKKIF